jgi:hypothetical protein
VVSIHQPLVLILTSVSLTVVVAICGHTHHHHSDDADTFYFSPVLSYLMLFVGLGFCVLPLLPGASGDTPTMTFFLAFTPFSCGAFLASLYFSRYRVLVTKETLIVGAFRRRAVSFSEVIDWDRLEGRYDDELFVYLRDNERLKFSGLLSDFDTLVEMIDCNMAVPPAGQADCALKLQDQERKARGDINAGRITWIGIAIIAVVIFVFWRLDLLH